MLRGTAWVSSRECASYLCLTEEKPEAQRGSVTSPRVHSRHSTQVGLQAWVSDCEPLVGSKVPTLRWDSKTSISDADQDKEQSLCRRGARGRRGSELPYACSSPASRRLPPPGPPHLTRTSAFPARCMRVQILRPGSCSWWDACSLPPAQSIYLGCPEGGLRGSHEHSGGSAIFAVNRLLALLQHSQPRPWEAREALQPPTAFLLSRQLDITAS